MSVPDQSLLARVARGVASPSAGAPANVKRSILAQAATSYGAIGIPEEDERTMPTGFDPVAAALFEACVEASYLVANADGDFDAEEQRAFTEVVLVACAEAVQAERIEALLADLSAQLEEDGVEKRATMVARTVKQPDQQREVLRIAALMAHVSGGVSEPERAVLMRLAEGFDLGEGAVEAAIREAGRALSEPSA